MDKHPIETWDQLVHSLFQPAILLQTEADTINGYLVTAKELKETLRIQLLHDTFYNKTETENELLIERYQTISANLIEMLFKYQHFESITWELKQFYKTVSAQLEEIIEFLQNTYGRYFNADLILPLPMRIKGCNELKGYWKIISNMMSCTAGNIAIVNILDQWIKNFLSQAEEITVTYHQARYIKNLMKEISSSISTTTPLLTDASLTELLISWNFNEFTFIQQVCAGISTEIQNKESDECRLDLLKMIYKQVSQLLEKNDRGFHSAQHSAKQTILDWITQELNYQEQLAKVPEKKQVKEEIKIHTSISVPALALITRLFKESGIVTNTNQTEILRFFTAHFTTLRKSEFSYGHLHSKYYDADEFTKKKVYDYLMEMAKLCKKM